MANNNTKNPNAPVASQVVPQSIVGHPPVQAQPGQPPLPSSSIVGQTPVPYYDQNKGKGNN